QLGGSAQVDIDGKNPKFLKNKWSIFCASGAPDIFYFSENDPLTAHLISSLNRDSTEMNSPVKITDRPVQFYAASPDAKSVAYIYWDDNKKGYGMEVLSVETGAVKNFTLPSTAVQKYSEGQFVIRFTADGKNLSFINDENGFANVWLLPLGGDKPRRLTNFNDNFIFSFA